MFKIIVVPDDAFEASEQLRTEEKFWYWHNNQRYLLL
jgi:hypothetical protein